MKRLFSGVAAILFLAATAFSQTSAVFNGQPIAAQFGQYRIFLNAAVSSGSNVVIPLRPADCLNAAAGNLTFFPLATTTPLTIDTGSNAETVTPSAVSWDGSSCSVTATISNNHAAGVYLTSGTGGVQEALNYLGAAGGTVLITPAFSGTGSNITSATGNANDYIKDIRSGDVYYAYNGTNFSSLGGPATFTTANGAILKPFVNSELLTLSTGGTTTDTSGNLLPANSIILLVTGRVTTTISGGTCSGWQLGDATTAGRFTASDTTLTANETMPKSANPPVQLGTGVASATTGLYQPAAAKVRVTCATGAPGAGAVRISVFGYT